MNQLEKLQAACRKLLDGEWATFRSSYYPQVHNWHCDFCFQKAATREEIRHAKCCPIGLIQVELEN